MEDKQTVQFQAETQKLLQMMIHSVYTEKEIFLRELISNASDALDKRYMLALAHPDQNIGPLQREAYSIRLTLNKKERLLCVSDNGIGMNEEDVHACLGTIAFSGTDGFRLSGEETDRLIGQFGIGFYSLFMAADRVNVITRKAGDEQAWVFASDGINGYTVSAAKRESCGTDVILHIREDDGKDTCNRYLREYTLYKLVKRYSDYIRWPILLYMPVPVPDKDGTPTEKWGWQKLNSMIPLWHRRAPDVTQEEYEAFWQEQFLDPSLIEEEKKDIIAHPLRTLHLSIEGKTDFKALVYIPACAWKTYDTKDDRKGLQLYSSGVRIMDVCRDVLPEAFPFVKGAVDCGDLPLNISRETVQSKQVLSSIRDVLHKRIGRALAECMKNERERYEIFFASFGKALKAAAMEAQGSEQKRLADLLLFECGASEKPVSLAEYCAHMRPEQNAVYYACGRNRQEIQRLPETEAARAAKADFLCLSGLADTLIPQVLGSYDGHPFISLADGEAEVFLQNRSVLSDVRKEKLLRLVKEAAGKEIDDAVLSVRLRTSPVLLSSGNGITYEMEKSLHENDPASPVKAERILELNASHPAVQTICRIMDTHPERARKYALILVRQAYMTAGLAIEDPASYTELLCSLMTEKENQ